MLIFSDNLFSNIRGVTCNQLPLIPKSKLSLGFCFPDFCFSVLFLFR